MKNRRAGPESGEPTHCRRSQAAVRFDLSARLLFWRRFVNDPPIAQPLLADERSQLVHCQGQPRLKKLNA